MEIHYNFFVFFINVYVRRSDMGDTSPNLYFGRFCRKIGFFDVKAPLFVNLPRTFQFISIS